MLRQTAAAALVLSLSTVAVAEHHETATREDFVALGKLQVGRWVGDITFIADWPGEELGKGDKVVAYTEYKWSADKNLIEREQDLGNSQIKQFFFYDAPAERIRFTWISSSGGSLVGHCWKKSDLVFGWRITSGGMADGRVQTGEGETVFSSDRMTHSIKGSSKLDGKDLAPLNDVYKRLSPLED
ncbi:hypothetical protein NZK35_33460 [Stieleria sp. ICT_E10.1]|uniref:hypothetical protein n=1 Tax=Stieleria sedimenti TaxID=2976331 RepID=UPI00217FA3DE|nr:hypothetical protein [Stieleria sedimenti]MCS7471583.1 hypothetical protein [Stieleria sedimenti]